MNLPIFINDARPGMWHIFVYSPFSFFFARGGKGGVFQLKSTIRVGRVGNWLNLDELDELDG